MARAAAAQTCSGVGKSGSPRLKSDTLIPSAFICLARAPAASVAEGCTAEAIFERRNMSVVRCPWVCRFVLSPLSPEAGERGEEGGSRLRFYCIVSTVPRQREREPP